MSNELSGDVAVNRRDREEFACKLRWARYSEDDFVLSESEMLGPAGSIDREAGYCISVTRCSTGTGRTYAAGFPHIWLTAFERDLKTGVFGKP